jgi:hypothetical protein
VLVRLEAKVTRGRRLPPFGTMGAVGHGRLIGPQQVGCTPAARFVFRVLSVLGAPPAMPWGHNSTDSAWCETATSSAPHCIDAVGEFIWKEIGVPVGSANQRVLISA